MQAVAIDGGYQPSKNPRMNDDERKRVGRKLRALRVEKGLTQAQLANDKRVRIAIGTLQSIERGLRENRDSKIERVAKFLGTTLVALRAQEGPIQPSDPRLKGLTDEDLRIARLFHDSTSALRNRIRALLKDGDADRITQLADRMAFLSTEAIGHLEGFVGLEEAQKGAGGKALAHNRAK